MASAIERAGRYLPQPGGYRAFVPAPLPPDPPVQIDRGMAALLSRADQALGRLDGISRTLPNPDLFVAMYVRREAVLSSQIEGTQSTLEDVLSFELDRKSHDVPRDVEEVVNYVAAMNYGLARLSTLPLSLRLIREIHGRLLEGVRGAQRQPGEFRRTQNWIAPGRVPISQATFVPPPVDEMHRALDDLERFMQEERELPVLIHIGLAHAHFETIHPFLDGNGRIGRLLITFLLVHRETLHRPLLYLSHYLRRHRAEYYDRLMAVRDSGDWEGWLRFFLRGAAETAEEAAVTARTIVDLRERHRALIDERRLGANALRLLDFLFQQPLVNVNLVRERLRVTFPPANRLVKQFAELGLLRETSGGRRYRRYKYNPYLDLFEERDATAETAPVQMTESP
jgi:Fic family protein